MELLRQTFERAGVAQSGEIGLGFELFRHGCERACDVGGGDGVLRHDRRGGLDQLGENLGVQFAIGLKVIGLGEGGHGLAGVLAAEPVDATGREAGAVEQDLGADDVGTRRRRGGGRGAVGARSRGRRGRGCGVRCFGLRLPDSRFDGLGR